MNEAIIVYGSVLVGLAVAIAIYINYQEKTEKNKKAKHH